MRGRVILMLLGILIVIVAVAALIENGRHRATTASGTPFLPGLKSELVDRIRMRSQGKETILEKKDEHWIVATEGGFPAEPRLVSDILDRLPKFAADEVVSTNPANRSIFQVDSTGVEVWVSQQGKEIGHFFVGKPGPDYTSTYIRPASSDRVILIPEYLPSLFQRSDTWRERTIFQLKEDDIRRFEYDSPSRGHIALTKDDAGRWHIEGGDTTAIESQKVGFALRTFASLKAAGFADTVTAAVAGLDPDTTRITTTLADGTSYELQVGLPTAGNRNFVRKKGEGNILVLPRGNLNTMMLQRNLLQPAPVR